MANDIEEVAHVVSAEEHLYSVAADYGTTVDAIWSYGANKNLANTGRTPGMLAAGDVVIVPKPTKKAFLPVTVGQPNTFTAKPLTVSLSIKILGEKGEPLASEPWEVPSLSKTGVTSGEGALNLKGVPVRLASVAVHLTKQNAWLHLRVGKLDPASSEKGRMHRLRHLGYLPSFVDSGQTDLVEMALAAFAFDHAPEAKSTAAIDKALVDFHGG